MKNFLTFSLILSATVMLAQKNFVITYEVSKKIADSILTNYYSLVISPEQGTSYFFEKAMEKEDSLKLYSQRIIRKDYKSNKISHYEKFQNNYYYFEYKPTKNYEIIPCSSNDLKCGILRTKNDLWTIEFSDKYPISDGPYNFYGLPGLIFNMQNESKTFEIKLIQIQNKTSNIDLQRIVKHAKRVSEKKFNEAKAVERTSKYLLDDFSSLGVSKDDLKILENMFEKSELYDLFSDFE